MIRRICDRCFSEEPLDEDEYSPPNRLKKYVHPQDNVPVDLCRKCSDEFSKIKEVERQKQLEESLNNNLLFWSKDNP